MCIIMFLLLFDRTALNIDNRTRQKTETSWSTTRTRGKISIFIWKFYCAIHVKLFSWNNCIKINIITLVKKCFFKKFRFFSSFVNYSTTRRTKDANIFKCLIYVFKKYLKITSMLLINIMYNFDWIRSRNKTIVKLKILKINIYIINLVLPKQIFVSSDDWSTLKFKLKITWLLIYMLFK